MAKVDHKCNLMPTILIPEGVSVSLCQYLAPTLLGLLRRDQSILNAKSMKFNSY